VNGGSVESKVLLSGVMFRVFPAAEDKAALLQAVKDVESASSAEVVITVRPQSGSYLHADLVLGVAFALATLWFLLFSPWEFRPEEILVGPLAVGALAGLLAARVPALRRLLTRKAARRERVLTAARASFVAKRVSHTSGRTGLLVYVSLLERAVEVVADRGVLERVPEEAWKAATGAVDSCLARGLDGGALADSIRALATVLAPVLPHTDDDVNELPDEIEA